MAKKLEVLKLFCHLSVILVRSKSRGESRMSQRKIVILAGSIVLFLILGVILVTSWYTVDESEQAVIMKKLAMLGFILNFHGRSSRSIFYQEKRSA
jgi:hypothetical protein